MGLNFGEFVEGALKEAIYQAALASHEKTREELVKVKNEALAELSRANPGLDLHEHPRKARAKKAG